MVTGESLDLAPRTSAASERPPRRGPRWLSALIIAGLLVGAFVAVRVLAGAAVFFHTVDEAVAMHAELGTKRFRIEGMVVPDSVQRTPEGISFAISNGNAVVQVSHTGDPPQLFQPCIPVVLEGAFTSADSPAHFSSETMLVKHTEEYQERNADRLEEADAARASCSGGGDYP